MNKPLKRHHQDTTDGATYVLMRCVAKWEWQVRMSFTIFISPLLLLAAIYSLFFVSVAEFFNFLIFAGFCFVAPRLIRAVILFAVDRHDKHRGTNLRRLFEDD